MTSSFYHQSQQEPPPALISEPKCQFQVRFAQYEDLDAIAQIIAESFHSSQGFWGWTFPLLRLGISEDLKHRVTSTKPHQACLVAIDTKYSQDIPIGTVELGLRYSDRWTQLGRSYPYLSNLAVHPQYRRRGVASGLLQRSEELVREWGFQDIYLHVLEKNQQARQLYFKQGYRVHQEMEARSIFCIWQRSQQIFLHKYLPN